MIHRMLCRAGLVLLCAAVTGPAFAQSGDDKPAKPAEEVVVASIDGKPVHLADLEAAKELLPEEVRRMPTALIYRPLLDRVIDSKLMAGAARKENFHNDPAVKRRLMLLEDQLIQQAYMSKKADSAITDEALGQRYEVFVKEHEPEEEVKARHILVETEDEAKAVIKELNAGADFAELAKTKSVGPSKETGGDLGFFTRDQMVSEFAEAAFNLEKGKFTAEPVKTQFGWHVIKVEDRREKPAPAFDEVRDQLAQEMARELFDELMADLRGEVAIVRYNMDGTPLEDEDAEAEGSDKPAEGSEEPAKGEEKPAKGED